MAFAGPDGGARQPRSEAFIARQAVSVWRLIDHQPVPAKLFDRSDKCLKAHSLADEAIRAERVTLGEILFRVTKSSPQREYSWYADRA